MLSKVVKLENYQEFEQHIEDAVKQFRDLDPKETIRIVSHLDSDGICASAILIKALNLENRKYSISIIHNLDGNTVRALADESYKYIFFTDIGSGQLKLIKKHLNKKKVFILDHHDPELKEVENIIHINPHIFGIDGSKQISGAGVVYLFAKTLNRDLEDMAHIAVMGAIGDIQDDGGLSELNKEILETAVKKNKIKIITGLRLFGVQTRPLHKVLEYCTNPYIPGVTGSESGAIQFLKQIGIEPKKDNEWRKLVHLSQSEIKRLTEGIIMRRLDEENPEEIIGPVYILREEQKESPLRDIKEFSTLLNACGRMNKASLGIGACLGDEKIKQLAVKILSDYRREIINALKWYEKNKKSNYIIREKGFVIINTQDKVMPTIVGTLASIISKSNEFEAGSFIVSMAQMEDGYTKVSVRLAGNSKDADLNALVLEIAQKLGIENAGGHQHAAGALIPTEKEEDFIRTTKTVLRRWVMEERVV